MNQDYIITLEKEFLFNANAEYAVDQKKYLKDKFEFFGMKTPKRREVQKPFLQKEFLPPKDQLTSLIKELWLKPQREFQYFALDLAYKYRKQLEFDDIKLFEFMILNKSWWDTVDGVAPKLVSDYFLKFPEQRDVYTQKWLESGNIWLQRSCVIWQLSFKEDLDTEYLSIVIKSLLGSKEFFINKAIGWMLRQYSRTNPAWVLDFVESTELNNLSKREALRLIY
ncbi:DNA alkylation repair protein [Labilibacter sediminis]|nr:DNA alkylation repair protein [Labilibacter sediminis]